MLCTTTPHEKTDTPEVICSLFYLNFTLSYQVSVMCNSDDTTAKKLRSFQVKWYYRPVNIYQIHMPTSEILVYWNKLNYVITFSWSKNSSAKLV